MKNKLLVILLISVSFLTSCKKTEEDKDMEEKIVGHWIAKDSKGNPEQNIPEYTFEDNNEGFTSLNGQKDEMSWEIKNSELNIYYDKAPDYMIGYDKYNSRSLFKIHNLKDDHLEVTQYFNDGYQSDLDFYRQ